MNIQSKLWPTLAQLSGVGVGLVLLGGCGSGGCGSGGPPSAPPSADGGACAWGVDTLLNEVGAHVGVRKDCGSTNGALSQMVASLMECFDDAVAEGTPVEFTVNNCVDCSIPSTYVFTEDGEFFRIVMESDHLGDDRREATVERCDEIAGTPGDASFCTGGEELYQCDDRLR